MPPYEKQLLEETAKLTRENNKILRSMQRAVWYGRVFGFIKWVIIIGITIGAYYYIQPYLNTLLSIYGNLGESVPGLNLLEGGLNLGGVDLGQVEETLKQLSPGE